MNKTVQSFNIANGVMFAHHRREDHSQPAQWFIIATLYCYCFVLSPETITANTNTVRERYTHTHTREQVTHHVRDNTDAVNHCAQKRGDDPEAEE